MRVKNIQLNTRQRGNWFLPGSDPSRPCEHRWEVHLWERGRAYCPDCGSFADRDFSDHVNIDHDPGDEAQP